jgi:hypothetical protein
MRTKLRCSPDEVSAINKAKKAVSQVLQAYIDQQERYNSNIPTILECLPLVDQAIEQKPER